MNHLDREEWKRLLNPLSAYIPLGVGAVAEDVEEGGRVLVVEDTGEEASEYNIEALGMTVAEANPAYPADDRVYTCVFLTSIPDEAAHRDVHTVARDLIRNDWKSYSFPESRLETVAPDRAVVASFDTEVDK